MVTEEWNDLSEAVYILHSRGAADNDREACFSTALTSEKCHRLSSHTQKIIGPPYFNPSFHVRRAAAAHRVGPGASERPRGLLL